MLASARASAERHGVGGRIVLAESAAETLDVQDAFGLQHVDHVIFSYSLSMMPDWRAAIERGFDALAPGGTLHAVDFWDLADWPILARGGMRAWLSAFGVHSSSDRCHAVSARAVARGGEVSLTPIAGRYAWRIRVRT